MSEPSTVPKLKAPFPYFGGKSKVSDLVWERFGDVPNYVEPFAGSLGVLLGRPHPPRHETVNDLCGMICNFWRAVKVDPLEIARYADNPVNENDLHARHAWLVGQRESLTARLEGDPEYFDVKIAGWWVWGLCCWIGSGFCSGEGPWNVVESEDGFRKLIRFGSGGQGVNRKLVHLGDAGRGVNRSQFHFGNTDQSLNEKQLESDGSAGLLAWFKALSARIARVRVCSGDWSRICGPSPTVKLGLTAVFLDPPYADTANRSGDLYLEDSLSVAHDVHEWAIAHGDDPNLRIALCGYEGEHTMPESWDCVPWKTNGGHSNQSATHDNPNARRERIWFSPHCLNSTKQAKQSGQQELTGFA